MFQHQVVNNNSWSLQGDWLQDSTNPSVPANSRMGYFLFTDESIDTINAANATANINASNTVIRPHPHSE
ncbi:hypothetical protein [Ureibacillus manganicus]|uniref:hypothetical protein n=1 Tax=Ureibacillus manganicus TaxID=1266064 RepID=UPI00146BC5B7|nr:hypothetical protein [Ureibacillus manganicus]